MLILGRVIVHGTWLCVVETSPETASTTYVLRLPYMDSFKFTGRNALGVASVTFLNSLVCKIRSLVLVRFELWNWSNWTIIAGCDKNSIYQDSVCKEEMATSRKVVVLSGFFVRMTRLGHVAFIRQRKLNERRIRDWFAIVWKYLHYEFYKCRLELTISK